MNDLDAIWKVQKDFQKNFYDPDNTSVEERTRLTKEYILSMHRELGEVLNIIPWKLHRANTTEYDKEHLQEELIDCFKFLLNVCILHGMTPDTFSKQFYDKSVVVEKRYAEEILKNENKDQMKLPFPKTGKEEKGMAYEVAGKGAPKQKDELLDW